MEIKSAMRMRDLRAVTADEPLETDICIVGSGPAGATVALELSDFEARVLVLESGDLERKPATDSLNEIENWGRPRVADQWLVRNRMIGGTSNTWAGRCTLLDEIDHAKRDWVPHSGWPFDAEELRPYISRSAEHLGLLADRGIGDRHRDMAGVETDLSSFKRWSWHFSLAAEPKKPVNFADKLLSSQATNLELICNATVTHIDVNEAGTAIEALEVCDLDGKVHKVKARCVVLAAGGIENARLLLASNRRQHCGVGNRHGLVGRFLMDHLKGAVGLLEPRATRKLRSLFGMNFVKGPFGKHRRLDGLQLCPTIQQKQCLLNGAIFIDETDFVASDDPWLALKRLSRTPKGRDLVAVIGNLRFMGGGIHEYLVRRQSLPRKLDRLELKCIVEQQPDPSSRITLSDTLDRFATPRARVDWKINELDRRTIRVIAELAKKELARMGIPLLLEPWTAAEDDLPGHFLDIAHPMGTTRMADHPSAGVVDRHCQVHGVDGLFAAGSSVFATSGHANPTQMLVALAVRLADKIKASIVAGARTAHSL